MIKLMKREIQLGEYLLGDGKPCFITFEAGPTHSGLKSSIQKSLLKIKNSYSPIQY